MHGGATFGLPPALLLLLCLGLGCRVSAPPKRPPPPVEVPAAWSAGGAESSAVTDVWWQTLGATGLAAVVEEALLANWDLKVAAARLEAAVAQARIAGAAMQPRAGFDFGANRQERNFIGLPIPGAGNRVLTSRSTSYGATFSVSWELDLWGRIRAGRQAALAEVQASAAELAAAKLSLAAQTARAWLAATEAAQQVALARQTVTNLQLTTAQVRRRYDQGLAPNQSDLRLALANEAAARAALAERQSLYERTLRQLEILLGRYPRGMFEVEQALPPLPPPPPAGLPAELLERRPDLVAAERRLAAADARLLQAKAALYPRITLTTTGGTSTRDLVDLLDLDYKVWSLAANVVQPLFEGGRLRAEAAQARARAEQAMAEYARTMLQAFAEVETALAVAAPLAAREQELAEEMRQAQAAWRLAEERYVSGLENYLSVLAAQRQVINSQSQRLAVQRAIWENRINLHLALGGGFSLAPSQPASHRKEDRPRFNPR
ncbi:MAG: efflux transporter outer membrane subunit [Verrucomicrobiae bacterium]|nr:efflux transporter outer membrane subunit [Verrucomicrobiae bacterium]